ncbi:L-carnitine dehydratase/bile acid-inducible protein F [Syntrophobacter sp. SbD1]|nr:L-carnitine dehydratase/bile acid-inducible protein F [Syntrophobacter sp. SbD1]
MSDHDKDKKMDWRDWIKESDDPAKAHGKPEALDHLTVLDCSYANMAGCFATSTLAEFGAEVIRIEPTGGDPVRSYSPWGLMNKGTGLGYLNEGRNKFHVTLNLQEPEAREIFKKLAKRADVIVETLLPGVMDEWGIGYRQLSVDNPGLIYCAIYSYGQFGPMAACGKADADVVNQVYSGITGITGECPEDPDHPKPSEVPTRQGNWMGWYAGGAWATAAMLAALHHRVNTGKGQFIDVSPAEAFGRCINYGITYYQGFQDIIPRLGNWDPGVFPYTYFRCKDGYAFLAGFSDINWEALCTILNRPDLRAQFPTIFDRLNPNNMGVMYKEIEKWTSAHTYDEIYDAVMAYNKAGGKGVVVPGKISAPIDTMKTENWWDRHSLQKINDPHYGETLIANQAWKMTKSPPRVKWVCRPVGADNEHVYGLKLGLGPKQLATMKKNGLI